MSSKKGNNNNSQKKSRNFLSSASGSIKSETEESWEIDDTTIAIVLEELIKCAVYRYLDEFPMKAAILQRHLENDALDTLQSMRMEEEVPPVNDEGPVKKKTKFFNF